MFLERITYGRTESLGNYNNVRIEMEATLGEDDDPKEVVGKLRIAVESEIALELAERTPHYQQRYPNSPHQVVSDDGDWHSGADEPLAEEDDDF